jgi:hypothetical protein
MEIKIRKGGEVFPCFTYPSRKLFVFFVRDGHGHGFRHAHVMRRRDRWPTGPTAAVVEASGRTCSGVQIV